MIQERVIIRTGADTFDVIVGHKLNDKPLSRAAADRLAHAPAKATAPDNLAPEPVPPAPKPKLNAPVVARSGDETKAQMARVNAASVSPDLFRVDGWSSRGGSSGFSIDNNLVSGKKPW